MGTLCMISGSGENSIRGLRTRRKNAIRGLFADARNPALPPANRLAINAIACELERISKHPGRTGADKEARFRVVINREKFQSPV